MAYPEFWASLIFLLLPMLWFWEFVNGWGTAKTVSRIHGDCLVSARLGFWGIVLPWLLCTAFTVVFAFFVIPNDDSN